MTVGVNNSSSQERTWAMYLGGNDVPFTSIPAIVGFWNGGDGLGTFGWNESLLSTTSVWIRTNGNSVIRVVAEGTY